VLFLEIFLFKSFQKYVVQQLPTQYLTDGSFGKLTIVEVICLNFQRSLGLDELVPPAHAEYNTPENLAFSFMKTQRKFL
jgi:hypothetical protein